ncbi:MAG: oxidoreductase [Mogibacterium sp.]|nr:oxidoreductase [Mogibacterium sp.]
MRQVFHDLSTYSADLFGINSALYELGGLIVMHDASGCNSTYKTHDDPRWYTMDSMVYVSGLNEKDAILGNDQRVIDDICAVVEVEHPKFVAFSVSVLPAYMGTDVRGIARLIERRTGVPSFGFATNGMDTYIPGAGMAFRAIAERFCPADRTPSGKADDGKIAVNLLGVTPLDFSVNGNVEALEQTIRGIGFTIQSNWAMGCTLEKLQTAPEADVNLVVSATGFPAAEYFQEAFGIPYVVGLPCGRTGTERVRELLAAAAADRKNRTMFAAGAPAFSCAVPETRSVRLIGEPVHCASIRYQLEQEYGLADIRIACPMEKDAGVLRDTDVWIGGEAEITDFLNKGDLVIADPVYRRVTRKEMSFIDDPHDAYSGRMYHRTGRLFIGPEADLLAEL